MPLKLTGVLVFAVAILASPGSSRQTTPQNHCGVIEEALQETAKLKPEMTRDKVEVNFVLDGGMQFERTSRYLFRKCSFIKVDVEFAERGAGSPKEFSATDRVVKVSRPYLEYPAFD